MKRVSARMKIQKRLLQLACLACFAVISNQASAAEGLSGSRPNIILVMTDDQGMGDLACMGNPILKTPHIDKLYEQSTRFTDYQVSPTCAPTRAAILSGQAPFKVGVTHKSRGFDEVLMHGAGGIGQRVWRFPREFTEFLF